MHRTRPIKRNTLSAAIAAALLITGQHALLAQEQAGESDEGLMMEEIIVTATRRDSTVAEIPYNISAVSGDYIDSGKILSTGELLQGVPGANVIVVPAAMRTARPGW